MPQKESKNSFPGFDAETKRVIESALANGDRVELIPIKDGVRVTKIKRETIN